MLTKLDNEYNFYVHCMLYIESNLSKSSSYDP